jgi:hypothetical protein
LKSIKEKENFKGIAIGTAIGTAIGVALNNFAIGFSIGFVFAIAIIKKSKNESI